MADTPRDITETELEILQLLWQTPGATIRQLTEAIYGSSTSAQYATVQKMLDRLEAKGFVRRDRAGTAHQFTATVSREELIGRRLQDLAEKLCDGSLTPVLTHLVRTQKLNSRERQELRQLIDDMEPPPKPGKR